MEVTVTTQVGNLMVTLDNAQTSHTQTHPAGAGITDSAATLCLEDCDEDESEDSDRYLYLRIKICLFVTYRLTPSLTM